MTTIAEKRDEALEKARAILSKPSCSEAELTLAKGLLKDVEDYDKRIAAITAADNLFTPIGPPPTDLDVRYGPGAGYGSYGSYNGAVQFMDFSPAGRGAMGAECVRQVHGHRNILSGKAFLTGSEQAIAVPMSPSNPITLGRPIQNLLSVIPTQRISAGNQATFMAQAARTNAAAVVPAGALKPVSAMGLVRKTVALSVVATLSDPLDEYTLLVDSPGLQRFVADELSYMIGVTLEGLVATGDGTPPNFFGLAATSGIVSIVAAVDALTTLRKALTSAATMGYADSLVFVLHPADWEALELARASTSGVLELGGPVNSAAQQIWGVPVVLTTALTAKTALLINTSSLLLFTDGTGLRVTWGAPADQWQRNQVSARAELRATLGVLQPQSITKIALP